jgi:hypothetical protein
VRLEIETAIQQSLHIVPIALEGKLPPGISSLAPAAPSCHFRPFYFLQKVEWVSRPRGYPKTGGRVKGTPNRSHRPTYEMVREAVAASGDEGVTPLAYLLKVQNDPQEDRERRLRAATAAAPYIHPRLSQVEARVSATVGVREMSRDELLAIASQAVKVIDHEPAEEPMRPPQPEPRGWTSPPD